MTKNLILILFSFSLIGCLKETGNSGEEIHRIYDKLPCYFNGARVGTSAKAAKVGPKGGRCCPKCMGYTEKKGTSIWVPRETPVIAIADMELIHAINKSAEQNSKGLTGNKGHRKTHIWTAYMKPFDDLHLIFQDKRGNYILYYHLLSSPMVPGFDKGKCKRPKEFGTEIWKRRPENCGGYAYKNVKKGDVIGLSGTTGGGRDGDKHFSLGIQVPIQVGSVIRPRWVVPEEYFKWENLPSESDAYLFPVQSKAYLKKIGYLK
jgi:hypothetical protein